MNQHLLRQLSALNLQPCIENLVDAIWHDQPPKPCSLAHDHAILSGQNTQLKMAQCYAFLAKHSAQALVITDPASVCWLFNIRGHDVEFSPLLLAHAIITTDQSYLFVENDQIPAQLQYSLSVIKIQVVRTEQLAAILATITGTVLFDENQISDYLYTILKQKKYKSVDNPCLLWKACKNSTELMHAINGHIEDAVALCELLATIASGDCYGKTEYDIGQQLAQLRQSQKSYLCDSFATICGFRENSAIIHYSAHKESSKALIGDGMLLIDSGGQYLGATTDVTRTTYIGTPSLDHKNLYTQVLKGHIAIAAIKFPQNKVCGAHLDVLARQYLWQSGLDYPHGTGHGVGASLNVHEGPQSISLSSFKTKLQAGMILSNEPGYYRSGDFGIRIENLLYIKNSAIDGFLEFENLTLVPYEPCLINENLLTSAEKTYLSNYYEKIRSVIKPLLSQKAQKWLQQACADYMC